MSREQSASAVVMIRSSRFYPNPETASDNAFQAEASKKKDYSLGAQIEFDRVVAKLREAGVTVHVYNDTESPAKPDAIFPNNWFSTHDDGRVVLYPMFSPSRRAERRADVIDHLRELYQVSDVIDYTYFEKRGLYLEGTGSLVLDHTNRVAYVSLSQRSHREPLQKFCADFGYEPVIFTSASPDGRAIYHTNVMLCVGSEFALVGLKTITDLAERKTVRQKLESTGKAIIALQVSQVQNFAGNALELHNEQRKLLVLSERALAALTNEQRTAIAHSASLLPLSLPTIELAGGSARCMLASIHLRPLTAKSRPNE